LAHAAERTTIQMQTNGRVDFSKGSLLRRYMAGSRYTSGGDHQFMHPEDLDSYLRRFT
jgi:hypothetical protein